MGDYDVAVIGAGVFGAWSAYYLQRCGARVILIDAYGPGNNRSSSGDESRIIRMGYGSDEIYTRSAIKSLNSWRELFDQTGQMLFRQTGVLWLAHAGDSYATQTLRTLKRVGVECEELTKSGLSRGYPQFALDGIEWGFIELQSGVILARRAVELVVREAIRCGVEYLTDAVAAPVAESEFGEVTTINGRHLSARNFVFACGPWLPKLFPELLGERVRPTRQEVFYFGVPPGDDRFQPPKMPTWIDFTDEAYGMPDLDGRGVKVAIDRHGAPFDPDSEDRIASREGLSKVRERLSCRLPWLREAALVESRVCQYENTSNGDFLIDRHPHFENVWIVGGGSGHGFKHGPAVGEYVRARIENSSLGIEPRFSFDSKKTASEREVY
jgi:glycine/D-amino acid oxidase-like deaminating enzyme